MKSSGLVPPRIKYRGAIHGRPISKKRTLVIVSSSASSPYSPQPSPKHWDLLTDRLVVSSSIPAPAFSILVLPQVVQNAINMSSGNSASLSIISWEGYLSGLIGNVLMCTHFAGRGERSAVTVQLIGIANSMLVLSQVSFASFMPLSIFTSTVILTIMAVSINLRQLNKGGIVDNSLDTFWGKWQLLAGVFGIAVIPQVMSGLLMPSENLGLAPGAGTFLLLGLYFASQMIDSAKRQALGSTVHQLPGWAATIFFALSPLPQLVRNFLEPQCLEGLSVGTMLLALLGNALMVPRALFTRDAAWIAGSSWGTAAGWGQLLSMFLGTSLLTGQSYLSAAPFLATTIVLVAYIIFILINNQSVKAVVSSEDH